MRRRERTLTYRARRRSLKAARILRRAMKREALARRRQQVKAFEAQLSRALFGGAEPSWNEIREGARSMLRGARVTGGEQAAYDQAMGNLIKPDRGTFTE